MTRFSTFLKRRLLVPLALLGAASPLSAGPLGLGSDFDVLVEHNFTLNGAHVHGSSAVGGNLVLTGNMSEFGNHMIAGSGPGVVVGGQVTLGTNGRVNGPGIVNVGSLAGGQSLGSQGLVASGKTLYANQVNVGSVGLDFGAAFDDLRLLSQTMAGLSSTLNLAALTSGDAQNKQLNLGFTAGSSFEVLNLTAAEFMSFKNIQVSTPGAGTNSLIINVDLTGYMGGAITQNRNGDGDAASQILWNFYGADSLVLANQFIGTVLAPDLAFTHKNNDFKGQVIASSFTKLSGQVHVHRYNGDVPPVSVPDGASTLLLLLAAGPVLLGLRARKA